MYSSTINNSLKRLLVGLLFSSNLALAQDSDSDENKSSLAIFPALSFAPETSLQFGAAAIWVLPNKQSDQSEYIRESTVSPFFLYTLKNQIISAVNLNLFTPNENVINGSIRFFNFPDSYFGIGNNNDPDISEQYTNTFYQLEWRYLKPFSKTSFLGVGWDLQHNSIKEILEGGMLSNDSPTGIAGGTLFGLGPAFRFDSRNNTIYPIKGYFITIRSLFNYIGTFGFSSHLVDLRKYISLWNEENILAFQVRGNFTGGSDAPFYKLPQLGGDASLRGISNASLYRDRQMIYAQAEYRRPLFWRFGMTVFAGVGDVANDLGDYELSAFKYVGGLGGRFAAIPEDKLNIRIDLGVARGGQFAIYAGISEAF